MLIKIYCLKKISKILLGGLIGVTTPTKDGLMPKNQVCRNIAKINNLHCRLKCNISSPGEWVNGFLYVGSTSGSVSTVQKILGHTSVRTTQIYSEIIPETMIRDLEDANMQSC